MANVLKPFPVPLVQHLTVDGLYSGSEDMTVDGDDPSVEFWIQPPAGWLFFLHRMIVHIKDERTGFTSDVYGSEASALTNGLTLQYKDDNQVWCHFGTDVETITTNGSWTHLMYDLRIDVAAVGTPTNTILTGRFSFTKFGPPLVLDGNGDNQRLSCFVNDDLTGIVHHQIMVEGVAFKAGPDETGTGIIVPQAQEIDLWF